MPDSREVMPARGDAPADTNRADRIFAVVLFCLGIALSNSRWSGNENVEFVAGGIAAFGSLLFWWRLVPR